jgi:hypothetical protein
MMRNNFLTSHFDLDMIGFDNHIISTSKVDKEEVAKASFFPHLNEEEADMLSSVLGRKIDAFSERFSLNKNDIVYVARIGRIGGGFKLDFLKLEVLA